jgi:hypothetical protein
LLHSLLAHALAHAIEDRLGCLQPNVGADEDPSSSSHSSSSIWDRSKAPTSRRNHERRVRLQGGVRLLDELLGQLFALRLRPGNRKLGLGVEVARILVRFQFFKDVLEALTSSSAGGVATAAALAVGLRLLELTPPRERLVHLAAEQLEQVGPPVEGSFA